MIKKEIMKALIKTGLVSAGLLLSTTVSSENKNCSNTIESKIGKTKLTFKNVKKESILFIKDSENLILYKELIHLTGDYTKGFDLSSLPNGSYYFELNGNIVIRVIDFKVESNVVYLGKAKEKKYFKPIVYKKGKKVHVSKLYLDTKELEIKIYFNNNDLVLSEKIKKVGSMLGRIYDFSTSEKGLYTIVTEANERKFIKNIEI
jgi:hypothetical protein